MNQQNNAPNKGQNDINTVDERLNKGRQPGEQRQKDAPRQATVTPDNDNGKPGAPATETGNKNGGPRGENL